MGRVTFRAAAGMVVVDPRGLVLSCERAAGRDRWQMPQGGIEPGETPLEAALRELREETGIPRDAVTVIAEHPEWLAYELPVHLRKSPERWGQVLRWFLLRLEGGEAVIDVEGAASREFSAWRWQRLAELAEVTVAFRRPMYRRLAADFAAHLAS